MNNSLSFLPHSKAINHDLIQNRHHNQQLMENLIDVLERLAGVSEFIKSASIAWNECGHRYELHPEPFIHIANSLSLDAKEALILANGLINQQDNKTMN